MTHNPTKDAYTINSLISALIWSLSGEGLQNAVHNLHRWLFNAGGADRTQMLNTLQQIIYNVLRREAVETTEPLSQRADVILYASNRVEKLKANLLTQKNCTSYSTIQDNVAVGSKISLIDLYATKQEFDDFFEDLLVLLDKPNGFQYHFLEDVEWMIGRMFAEAAMNNQLELTTPEARRCVYITSLITSSASAYLLDRITYRGDELFVISPSEVAELHGQEDAEMLSGNIERLGNALPLSEYIDFLSDIKGTVKDAEVSKAVKLHLDSLQSLICSAVA